MFDLLEKIEARGAALLSGNLFEQPGSSPCDLRWFQLDIPPKRATAEQASDVPFCLVRLLGGSETGKVGALVVRLFCGLYVNPDRDSSGMVTSADQPLPVARDAVNRLVNGLRALGADGNYAPYSLESMKWWLGDEHGEQPKLNYFFVTFDLEFSQAPVINNF